MYTYIQNEFMVTYKKQTKSRIFEISVSIWIFPWNSRFPNIQVTHRTYVPAKRAIRLKSIVVLIN